MNDEMQGYLTVSLRKLEKALEKTIQSQGYGDECEHMKMLQELIKEQMPNENTSYSVSSSR